MSNRLGNWIIGAMVAVLGLIGLFLSAYADDGVMDATGLLIAAFSVLFIFGLIGGHADAPEAAEGLAAGEGADGAGHHEDIDPLTAELRVAAAKAVDSAVQPEEVVVGRLEEGKSALV